MKWTWNVGLGAAAVLVAAGCDGAVGDPTAPAPAPSGVTLTLEPPDNGEILVDPPDVPYPAGTLVTVTAVPFDGFVFERWTGELDGQLAERRIVLNDDRTIGAEFRELGEYSVNLVPSDEGTIALDPPRGPYPEGTDLTVTAEAEPGFGFVGWTGDLTGTENPTTVRVTGDLTIGAQFDGGVIVEVANPFGGTLNTNPFVTSGDFFPYGSTIQVTAFPDPGFELDAMYRKMWLVEPAWPYFVAQRTTGFTFQHVLTPDDDRFTLDGSPVDKVILGAHFVPSDTWPELDQTFDLIYATPGSKPLRYDVFAPPLSNDLPIVVVIHGGGYVRNTEDVMRGVAKVIAGTGRYVVYSIDYRLATDLDPVAPTIADAVEDVLGAIAHARINAFAFGADPDRIALVGTDVGGHLATLSALVVDQIGDGGYDGTLASEFEPSFVPGG
ncbi:MAG: alpha/beta hydrolase fold domain-containing protein, partial [Myxococcota bacterium]